MEYQRFNWQNRFQHLLIIVSFLMCAFTGIPIKFSHFPWSINIAAMYGGFDNMLAVHLTGAAIMLGCLVYHLLYLVYEALVNKKFPLTMLPSLKDIKDIGANIKYYIGKSEEPPKFDRYSYIEKFDYLAVFWGMMAIGLTGLMMWFPDISARFVPRWIIDIGRVAHSDEAVLAIIVIFVWHFFNVHMNPKFFPMNKTWIDGKMHMEHFMLEHPLEYERYMASIAATEKPEKVEIGHKEGLPL